MAPLLCAVLFVPYERKVPLKRSTPLPANAKGCSLCGIGFQMLLGKEKWAITLLLALAILCQNACSSTGLPPTPQNGIVGKWRSADGSYVVEFLSTGNCSARLRMQGREVGGPCRYSADKDTITIRYYGLDAHPQDGEPNTSATWHYTLAGDTLNVSIQGVSLALQRVR